MSNDTSQINAPLTAKKSTLWKRLSSSRFFAVSILIHVLLVVVAGVVVMQTITTKRKPIFKASPPAHVRAKEPKFEVHSPQQTSAPPIANRITTPGLNNRVLPEMPDTPIPSPAITQMTAPVEGMPSTKTMMVPVKGGSGTPIFSPFGKPNATESAFVGTFYDLKQTRAKQPIAKQTYVQSIQEFANGFRESSFNQYYKGSIPLYTSMIMLPRIDANLGPKAFGVDKEVQPSHWVALYKTKVSPDKSGTIRFVGGADDIMLVSFGGKLVLDGCWGHPITKWTTNTRYNYKGFSHAGGLPQSDPIKVEAGKWYDMQVLIGEQPGGQFDAVLMLMEDGVTYQKDPMGGPILPPFRVDNVHIPQAAPKTMILPPLKRTGPVWKAQSSKPAAAGTSSLLRTH